MQEIVASVSNIKFDIETALELQIGAKPLPFPGMDKSGAAICTFHQRGQCSHGGMCPFRHVRGDRSIVCKHWLRGLCKKGDDCEFLHEFDMSKMPECYFYSKFGECANRECPFLHIDPESKRKDCPWYDRGFCRHGPSCKNRHVRRVLCVNYLCGFCLDGPACKFMHPKFELPTGDGTTLPMKKPICHHCGEVGHVIWRCFKISEEERANMQRQHQDQVAQMNEQKQQRQHGGGGGSGGSGGSASGSPMQGGGAATHQQSGGGGGMAGQPLNKPMYRSLDEVTCFKCGGRGHYANKCPKGHLAFLSSSSHQQQPPASQQPPPSMAPRMQTS